MARTSTKVKRRYNNKAYGKIQTELPKDLVEAFKAKCQEQHISQASIIKDAIEKFLADN